MARGPWQTGTVAVADGHLAYHRTGGPGPALVLSHGLGDNGLCWGRVATALEADFDVVMLDARGHGDSSRISEGGAWDGGEDIAEAIERLGLSAPILMGHSVGGRATAACAAAYPGRASKVVLEDPAFAPPPDPEIVERHRERYGQYVEYVQGLSPEALAALGHSIHANWDEAEFPAWREGKVKADPRAMPIQTTPWQDMVSAIRAPTLIIFGEAALAGMVTPAIAEEACRLNSRVTTVQIPGAGHNIRRERFDAFVAAVRGFLFG